jgi:hypothetical protein
MSILPDYSCVNTTNLPFIRRLSNKLIYYLAIFERLKIFFRIYEGDMHTYRFAYKEYWLQCTWRACKTVCALEVDLPKHPIHGMPAGCRREALQGRETGL